MKKRLVWFTPDATSPIGGHIEELGVEITREDIDALESWDKNDYSLELERLAKKLKALVPPK